MTNSMNGDPNEKEIINEDTLEVHPGYAYDADIGYQNKQWMSMIRDDVKTSELSIPGTHGSMALHGKTGFDENIVRNQRMSLTTQLNSGIRYLDMRARRTKESFAMHHGAVYQHAMFGDVLNDTINFLRQNPKETVFMRVKEEHDAEAGSLSFEAIFEKYWNNNPAYFWDPNSVPSAESNNPKLRDIRGKIVVIQNFTASKKYGISYGTLNNQDQFNVDHTVDSMYSKWTSVKNHLYAASNSNKSQIYLNHFSGTGGNPLKDYAYPYFVASGKLNRGTDGPAKVALSYATEKYPDYPRGYFAQVFYGGTNTLGTELIQRKAVAHTGIIAADFPGKGLIESVIRLNDKHADNSVIHHIGLNAKKNVEVGFTGQYFSKNLVITRNGFYIAHYANGTAYYASLSQTNYGHLLTYNYSLFNGDKIGVWLDISGNRTLLKEFTASIDENNLEEVIIPNDQYYIVSALDSSKVVDMVTGNNNVVLHSKHGDKNQQWNFVYNSSKQAYQISSEWTTGIRLVLAFSPGAENVFVTPVNLTKEEQYWKLRRAGNGYLYLENKGNGLVLDVKGSSTTNGTNIVLFNRTGTTNQKFKLTLV